MACDLSFVCFPQQNDGNKKKNLYWSWCVKMWGKIRPPVTEYWISPYSFYGISQLKLRVVHVYFLVAIIMYILGCNFWQQFLRMKGTKHFFGVVLCADHEYHNENILRAHLSKMAEMPGKRWKNNVISTRLLCSDSRCQFQSYKQPWTICLHICIDIPCTPICFFVGC